MAPTLGLGHDRHLVGRLALRLDLLLVQASYFARFFGFAFAPPPT